MGGRNYKRFMKRGKQDILAVPEIHHEWNAGAGAGDGWRQDELQARFAKGQASLLRLCVGM